MKFRKEYVFHFLILVTSFGLGSWWGFWEGVKHGGALEKVAFAHISTAQIERLENGAREDIDSVIGLFEIYVDSGIDQFLWYSESGVKYMGSLISPDYESQMTKSVKEIAKYRAENPENDISDYLSSAEKREEYLDAYYMRQALVESVVDTK